MNNHTRLGPGEILIMVMFGMAFAGFAIPLLWVWIEILHWLFGR